MKSTCSNLLLFCLLGTPAFASVVFLNSPLAPADTVNWSQLGSDGTAVSQNFAAVSGLGVSVSGSMAGNGGLIAVVCDPVSPVNCSWGPPAAGYAIGDSVIWLEDVNFAGAGPLTLAFGPQFGIGTYIQTTSSGAFTARLDAYSGVTLLATQTYSSDLSGDPLFLGAKSTAGDLTKVVIDVTSCGAFGCDPEDFSANTLQFYSADQVVPEPATFTMAGMVLVLGCVARKRSGGQRGKAR